MTTASGSSSFPGSKSQTTFDAKSSTIATISSSRDPLHSIRARDTLHLRLPNSNRTLAYAQYGSPTGYPLIYLHGYPSTRLEGSILHRAALKRNIRVLAPDRPGFGESTWDEGYTVESVARDVGEMATALELGEYAVLGLSGGGPYALACARWLGGEDSGLKAVGIACGCPYWQESGVGDMPWWTKVAWWFERWAPGVMRGLVVALARLVAWVGDMGWARRALERAIEEARRKKREREGEDGEDELGKVEEERKDLMRMLLEAFKQGGAPTVREFHLLANEWGFELRHVDFDKVILWHGTKDVNAPISGARYMAEALPHAELREYEGTHGEIITQIDDILETLVPKNDEMSA